MIIKVCGMRDADNIRAVEQTGADWMGFIFYSRSPRYVASLPTYMPSRQKRVGVFVNATTHDILSTVCRFGLQAAQLHGDESPLMCRELRKHGLMTIRTISVTDERDISRAAAFEEADYLLFDTHTQVRGGSGRRFDWQLLETYDGKTPFILSGGISESALDDILSFHHPRMAGIDLNSGFETTPAMKNADALTRFIAAVRNATEIRSQQ